MNTWHFDLTRMDSPLKESGLHGLGRLLIHGESDDHYPLVKQTDTLQWEVTDTAVTLQWDSPADLMQLMNCQLGDFHHGIGVPPGWCNDPALPGFYATVRAHQAIVGGGFSSMSGPRRSSSLGNVNRKKAWVAEHGCEPLTEVSSASEDGEHPITLAVKPHAWNTGKVPLLDLKVTAKGAFKKNQPAGQVLHPALNKWNNTQVRLTPEDRFLLSFSCLSYVYFWMNTGLAGVGLNLRTFSEADTYHRKWAGRHDPRTILSLHTNETTAFWCVAALLKLPSKYAYPTLSADKVGMFRPQTVNHETEFVYRVLHDGLTTSDKARHLFRLKSVPVRIIGHWDSDSKKTESLHDILLANLGAGRHWCTDLGDIALLSRGSKGNPFGGSSVYRGLTKAEQETLSAAVSTLESPMEKAIADKMGRLFAHLVRYYVNHSAHNDPNAAWEAARKRARQVACDVHLNRARNLQSILEAIYQIQKAAPDYEFTAKDGKRVLVRTPVFDDAEFAWILANQNLARSFLLFSCENGRPPWKAKTAQKEAPADAEQAEEEDGELTVFDIMNDTEPSTTE